jgi:hypothetical protein
MYSNYGSEAPLGRCCKTVNFCGKLLDFTILLQKMLSGYWERMELGVNSEEEDVTIPPHLLPVAPVVNHFQDFVLLVGFAEDEGPKPLV